MQYRITVSGVSPIIHHNGAAGLDTRSPLSREIAAIAAKRGGNRTEVDDDRLRELEAQRALWLDERRAPLHAITRCLTIRHGRRKARKSPILPKPERERGK